MHIILIVRRSIILQKLDGVARLMTDPPPTDSTTLYNWADQTGNVGKLGNLGKVWKVGKVRKEGKVGKCPFFSLVNWRTKHFVVHSVETIGNVGKVGNNGKDI